MKKLKLGYILVLERVIDRDQLEKALSVQRSNPSISLGEIVHKLFQVKEGVIEAIFVQHILAPTLREFFNNQLQKKFTGSNFEYAQEVTQLEVHVSQYTRSTTTSRLFQYENSTHFKLSEKKHFLSRIDCTQSSITFHTRSGASLFLENIQFEYNIVSQRLTLENPALIMEAKIKLNQIIKKAGQGHNAQQQ